jgi:precorrin-2 dehydrogenase/sirohydrochlorin ferrochelatase
MPSRARAHSRSLCSRCASSDRCSIPDQFGHDFGRTSYAGAVPPSGYPILLSLAGRSCVVVGGGHIALRKIATLLDAGAHVTVIAPDVREEIRALEVTIKVRRYRAGDLAGSRIAISATGDPDVDAAVFADGEREGVLVNVADDPSHCAFTLPAVTRRGSVSVAVATDGVSPALATWLRDRMAEALPDKLEVLVDLVSEARSAIRAAGVGTEGLEWHALITTLAAAIDTAPETATTTLDAFVAATTGGPRK